jgi:hypothetical protein
MKMRSNIRVVKDVLPQMLKQVSALVKQEVLVGIPEDKADRGTGEAVTNAELGYIHEFGAPEANIPARPFLVPGIASAQAKVADYFKQIAQNALRGRDVTAQGMNAAGLTAASAVKRYMATADFVPLSPVTLAARRRRGVTRTKPLIDTANLQNHITYVIRPTGKTLTVPQMKQAKKQVQTE